VRSEHLPLCVTTDVYFVSYIWCQITDNKTFVKNRYNLIAYTEWIEILIFWHFCYTDVYQHLHIVIENIVKCNNNSLSYKYFIIMSFLFKYWLSKAICNLKAIPKHKKYMYNDMYFLMWVINHIKTNSKRTL